MCIIMIIIFDMDSTQDIVYLKVQKIYDTYYFSSFDKFTVLNSKAPFFASVLLLLILSFLLLDSARGRVFLSKPLFCDRLMVVYPPWNYWNIVNTPFNQGSNVHDFKISHYKTWFLVCFPSFFLFFLHSLKIKFSRKNADQALDSILSLF